DWVKRRGLSWRLHRLGSRVRSVREASEALGVPPSRIVKTIVVVDGERTIACIVPGDRRLDMAKLRAAVGGSPRLATRREVRERTGYEAGGVPPSPLPDYVVVVLDERLLRVDRVYGGGGDEYTLLEFSPRDLVESGRVIVADISG
ncbi:MAG: YbaK/EbsC family protein, partial [Desulfurococcales archaeon]|nr:YbaK/EbsC family protein [Desulfurococcales archaeon]